MAEGISKKRLLLVKESFKNDSSYNQHDKDTLINLLDALISYSEELNQWLPIENAPKNREILVYAPPHDGLDALKRICKWHESAGFCIDEFRTVTHYQELPDDPKE